MEKAVGSFLRNEDGKLEFSVQIIVMDRFYSSEDSPEEEVLWQLFCTPATRLDAGHEVHAFAMLGFVFRVMFWSPGRKKNVIGDLCSEKPKILVSPIGSISEYTDLLAQAVPIIHSSK
jgi:hypothetical protein